MSEVEVLIPHHRGRETLARAVRSLERQTVDAAICVADNGSTDGSREMLAAEHPGVRLLELGSNRGFGAALNSAARSSDARLICLVNNDVEADERFVEELEEAQGESGAGAVAGVLRMADGGIDTAGVNADRSLIAYDHLHGEAYPPPTPVPPPLGPCGGAALFERETFLALGGFDEGFFAYLEDVDLAIRLRLDGVDCACAPRAIGWHRHAGTFGAGSAEKNRLLGYGRGRLLRKYGAALGPADRARGAAIDSVTYAGQLCLDRNAGAIRGRLEQRREGGDGRTAAGLEDFERLPLLDVGLAESLRHRWSRGRRYRSDG